MPDAYVIEVSGLTAGIVARDSHSHSFNFFSATRTFNAMEGQRFADPLAAERVARLLIKHGSMPRRHQTAPDQAGTDQETGSDRGRFG
jgi:hypothetical protein